MQDYLKITGDVNIQHFDANKMLVDERNIKNLVVERGKNTLAARLVGNAQPTLSYMVVGTSSTGASYTDTSVIAPIASSNTAISTPTVTANAVVAQATFGPGTGTGALQEAGLFTAFSATPTVGNLFCRTTFSTVTKGALDTVIITWTISVS